MRGRTFGRLLVLGLALLCLVPEVSAQRGKQKGRGRAKTSHPAAKANAGKTGALGPAKGGAKKPGAQKDAVQAKKQDEASKEAAKSPAMEEADRVTATADLQAEVDVERQRMLREHFKLCDLDANGWISLREAEITLSFGRSEFQRYDAGRDGRIDDAEFAGHSDELMARLGAIPKKPIVAAPDASAVVDPEALPPAGATGKTALLPRPQDLLRRYDANKSHGLDAAEISKMCSEVGLSLSTELVVEQMDPDDSGELDVDELTPLAWIAGRHLPDVLRPPPPGALDEPTADGSAPASPRARLSHFGRLDPSEDGTFDESDLRTLQSPVRLAVRLEAVVSAIDRDGDGRVTPEEFRSSMSSRP